MGARLTLFTLRSARAPGARAERGARARGVMAVVWPKIFVAALSVSAIFGAAISIEIAEAAEAAEALGAPLPKLSVVGIVGVT